MKMNYLKSNIFLIFALLLSFPMLAQTITKEQLIALTAEWKGERFPDGRPKLEDKWLERAKKVSLEEAWGVLRNEGYYNQFEGNWEILHPNLVLTGRALTAMYIPSRPDIDKQIRDRGKAEGRKGSPNSWPIDMLTPGDIYVADAFGKIVDGTLIGDNLGNAIYAKSKNGVVFYGSVRDVEGLAQIEGFNYFVKGTDPSFIQNLMLAGLNVPIRIGRAVCLPGDLVIAKRGGVIFVPAHLVEKVILNAEFISLRDQFGHQRLREGKYSPGEIDMQWTDAIKKDFLSWLDQNPDKLPMTRKELDEFMKNRTW
ncbi:RraA family protein [Thermoflexibacter ruber]|uniref:Demethylmenaquinone methyltransferase n=1 Tax=Thermoflexibacter ruber TaxID=1003 RepID=A0A1I2J0D1_9BACT|nr:Demethylmenaquinone methyltransferase [Thermoflexibacter ruber]